MRTVTWNQQKQFSQQMERRLEETLNCEEDTVLVNSLAIVSYFGTTVLISMRYFYQNKAKVQGECEANSSKRSFWCMASCSLAIFLNSITKQEITPKMEINIVNLSIKWWGFQHPTATFVIAERGETQERGKRKKKTLSSRSLQTWSVNRLNPWCSHVLPQLWPSNCLL